MNEIRISFLLIKSFILDDPTETTNLASSDPCKVKELELKLEEYKKNTVPPLVTNPPFFDSGSDPANFNDSWMPGWCD